MRKINETILSAFLGQLLDLKLGRYNEIVITKGENADLLSEIILDRFKIQRKKPEKIINLDDKKI